MSDSDSDEPLPEWHPLPAQPIVQPDAQVADEARTELTAAERTEIDERVLALRREAIEEYHDSRLLAHSQKAREAANRVPHRRAGPLQNHFDRVTVLHWSNQRNKNLAILPNEILLHIYDFVLHPIDNVQDLMSHTLLTLAKKQTQNGETTLANLPPKYDTLVAKTAERLKDNLFELYNSEHHDIVRPFFGHLRTYDSEERDAQGLYARIAHAWYLKFERPSNQPLIECDIPSYHFVRLSNANDGHQIAAQTTTVSLEIPYKWWKLEIPPGEPGSLMNEDGMPRSVFHMRQIYSLEINPSAHYIKPGKYKRGEPVVGFYRVYFDLVMMNVAGHDTDETVKASNIIAANRMKTFNDADARAAATKTEMRDMIIRVGRLADLEPAGNPVVAWFDRCIQPLSFAEMDSLFGTTIFKQTQEGQIADFATKIGKTVKDVNDVLQRQQPPFLQPIRPITYKLKFTSGLEHERINILALHQKILTLVSHFMLMSFFLKTNHLPLPQTPKTGKSKFGGATKNE